MPRGSGHIRHGVNPLFEGLLMFWYMLPPQHSLLKIHSGSSCSQTSRHTSCKLHLASFYAHSPRLACWFTYFTITKVDRLQSFLIICPPAQKEIERGIWGCCIRHRWYLQSSYTTWDPPEASIANPQRVTYQQEKPTAVPTNPRQGRYMITQHTRLQAGLAKQDFHSSH